MLRCRPRWIINVFEEQEMVSEMQALLAEEPPESVSQVVSCKTEGKTPLVMACRNGHLGVVEYLVDRCNADIEQSGQVVFDGDTIEGAPPLWCAAAAGHFEIVKFLVRRGAKVNSVCRSNSTPLRAACYDGHFEIVKFLIKHGADASISNRHGHTCLMIACYKGHYNIAKYLLSLNVDVNFKSVKGNTALHDCAESGSLSIMKLLIERGAKMDVDAYGMTPLLGACVTGHASIVEYLIGTPSLVTRQERIDALELLGTTYVDKMRDMLETIKLWRRAMEERYNVEPKIEKPRDVETKEAYEHAREFRTFEELDDLLSDPDEMRMQALLIRERILGPAHPDTCYYIRFRGAVYADVGKFSRTISLWNYALEMQQTLLEPLNPMTQSSLFSFAELFSFMMEEQSLAQTSSRNRPSAIINPQDVMYVFSKAIEELSKGMKMKVVDLAHVHRVLAISLYLACLLAKILATMTEEQKHQVRQMVYSLVSFKLVGRNGCTALHLACSSNAIVVGKYPACRFPSTPLVELLCSVGADVNARDWAGNTPLHLAAQADPIPVDLVQALLKAGAHLDYVNHAGETFKDLLAGQPLHQLVNELHFTKLSCLAARVIRQHKIPFEGEMPACLESVVTNH
ncbi:protein fem-1 homolog CG6966 isoform X2 [Bemisia tabaci]|uniref:protein fem-1 homolog CG6966 isoform X2 n=1 Tax=Bemisia tabaci TaxID=7038 RepID=UPI0008F987A9|nr:PREDICTED: protein fem-1 homolog CG6966 isoform X2 [Bemisia tabaci]